MVRRMGHECTPVESGEEAIARFAEEEFDSVICDLKLGGIQGMEVIEKIHEMDPTCPIIVVTAHYLKPEHVMEAARRGATDYLIKSDFSKDELVARIDKALRERAEKKDREKMSHELLYHREIEKAQYDDSGLVGRSIKMREILDKIERVARTDSTVIIYGESGTGKDLVARAIHYRSPRADMPFIKVDCSALAEGVLESELFGHERGAFTGAIRQKPGRFELAHKGTIFLDEIGDLSPNLQLKLLRVLQERSFERVGGTRTITVDVRVIAATNKDLWALVQEGRFREDLYYRLNVVAIEVPPLRQRKEDIPDLVHAFLQKLKVRTRREAKGITSAAMKALVAYSWPGNVRELENVIEQAMVLSETGLIDVFDLPDFVLQRRHKGKYDLDLEQMLETMSLPELLDNIEKDLIQKALQKSGGVKAEAARILGIKLSALYYKLEKYGLMEGREEK
ncbi:MAG TPA: sigma-54-dependent Fis family transcriptional regulator [Proteobacteria bacterium]|nr:sigma-54-dependent Fis family transcriptional regulator [Pseudomonadota bacterium]